MLATCYFWSQGHAHKYLHESDFNISRTCGWHVPCYNFTHVCFSSELSINASLLHHLNANNLDLRHKILGKFIKEIHYVCTHLQPLH